MNSIWRYAPDTKFSPSLSGVNGRLASSDELFRIDNFSVSYKLVNNEYWQTIYPINDAMLKWNNGGTWITDKPIKYYNGTNWIVGKPIKLWSGTRWVTLT